jgi:SPP1 gp7 family putative phage head morphogenesis protein
MSSWVFKSTLDKLTANPFVSEAQRAWMYANKPAMAKEWQSHTPRGKKLPRRKKRTENLGPLVVNRKQRDYDPSRTIALRKRITLEMRKRFRLLKGKIVKLVVDGDAFGLKEPKANSRLDLAAFKKAGDFLKHNGLMPGYGQIFVTKRGSGQAWYVGGDGDEDGFEQLVKKTLLAISGIDEVCYAAEGFPPRNGTWLRVYPDLREHLPLPAMNEDWGIENAFCPNEDWGIEGGPGTTRYPNLLVNCKPLIEVPDVRQNDQKSCGAAASMSVGLWFGVGPETLDDWKQLLHTGESTRPQAIIQAFQDLGLRVRARAGMTVEDLRRATDAREPVICPVQSYGPTGSYADGHYLVVIGVDKGYIFCQDSSVDNVIAGSESIQKPGRVMIAEEDWLRAWHDQDEDGRWYHHFGIAVGDGQPWANVFCGGGPGSGVHPECKAGEGGGSEAAKPIPISKFSYGDGYMAKFEHAGHTAQVIFERSEEEEGGPPVDKDDKAYDLRFSVDGRYALVGAVGGGAALGIFRKVGKVVDQFLSMVKPDMLSFSAHLREPSRVRLYDGLSKMLGQRYGYDVQTVEDKIHGGDARYRDKHYYLVRNEAVVANVEGADGIELLSFEDQFDLVFNASYFDYCERDPHGGWCLPEGGGAEGKGAAVPAPSAPAAPGVRPPLAKVPELGTEENPIKVGKDIRKAAYLLEEGYHVELNQPEQVSTLIDELHAMAHRAVAMGQKAPFFDLCKVTVANTNLFCQETLGIPRIQMPQMRGQPTPGTPSAALKASKKSGKVDISKQFIQYLADQGIKTEETEIRASNLRASQAQIVGSRVAQLIEETRAGDRDLRERPMFVTRDNYIVDGHHHWAAIVGYGAEKHKDFKIPVYKLDMDIGAGLRAANDFAKQMGLKPKSGTANEYVENAPPPWYFRSDADKIKQFQRWLQEQIDTLITSDEIEALWEEYTRQGYERGAKRAFDDVRKPFAAGKFEAADWAFYQGGKEEFLKSAFGRPVAVEKVKLLAGRSFDDLEGITADMSLKMSRVLTDGLVEGKGPRAIARDLDDEVDLAEGRAEVIARTEIIRAHAEGQLDVMENLGVEEVGVAVEWSTTGDDKVCDECEELEGVVLSIDEAHNLLPRHPNAVFAGSSFASYGACQELVRAWYRGPSVVLVVGERKQRTTIGPNHPMLTRRGMVPAAQLKKGDQVLRDLRADRSSHGQNLEQVPTVEDVFKSSLLVRGHSGIASSASDLHGDRVFCQGKVQAIRPAGQLLLIWDSFGVEQLRKDHFARSDPDLSLEPGLGAGNLAVKRVLVASASDVGGKRLPGSLSGGHLRPLEQFGLASAPDLDPAIFQLGTDGTSTDPESSRQLSNRFSGQIPPSNFFAWEEIHDVSFSEYEGFAFDASTATSLYCSSSFVVSNCRCAFIPANVGEDQEGQVRGRKAVQDAIDESADLGSGDWAGDDLKVSKDRPKGILGNELLEFSRSLSLLVEEGP